MKTHDDIIKRVNKLAYNHDPRRIFADFCEMFALAINQPLNRYNKPLWTRREEQFIRLEQAYSKSEMDGFRELREGVINAMEKEQTDVLGRAYEELEVSNKAAGQFFTPYHLCELMAEVTVDKDLIAKIENNGFVTVGEPACGSGAMLIAVANVLRKKGLNPQRCVHITAIDKSATAAYMCYIQLSLLGIPAAVWIGNTLSMEMQEKFLTPMHMIGGWAPSRGDVLTAKSVARSREAEKVDDTPAVDIAMPDTEQMDLFSREGAA